MADRPYDDQRVVAIDFMEVQPRDIRRYITPDGRNPFAEWLSSLRDLNAVVKIEQRLDRVRLGNLGNSKSVGEGVCELKIDFGPVSRVLRTIWINNSARPLWWG